MKKKLLAVLSFGMVAAFALTGCGTSVPNIQNNSTELLYNGGSVVRVGDHLFFGNAYTPVNDADTDFAYGANAKLSYMRRLNLEETGIVNENTVASPETEDNYGFNSKNGLGAKVVGFEQQYMFVLGDYIYYTSPNTHKTDKNEQTYKMLTFWRSKLNGAEAKEFFTTETFDSVKGKITTMKGSDNNYYLIVFDGGELFSFKLGKEQPKRKSIAKDVIDIAVPGEGEEYNVRKIFYTTNHKDSLGETNGEIDVCSVDYATGEKQIVAAPGKGSKVSFIDRVGDVIVYTNSIANGGSRECFYEDISASTDFSGDERFYSSPSITNVSKVLINGEDKGYIFVNGNDSGVMYKSSEAGVETTTILPKANYTDLLFVDGNGLVYYSTANGIFSVDVRNKAVHTIVEMTSIVSGKISHDDSYIYFYGQLELEEETDEEGNVIEYEEDTNSYMYRVEIDGNGGWQMLSSYTRVKKK